MRRSLYRAYRPQTFDELAGQAHVARTLKNAVETDSVAHAYVFAGPRGTGKTSTARILAKALDCTGTPDAPHTRPTAHPCGVCDHCRAIADAVSLDVIEMDAASNRSIDDVRELRDRVAFAPVDGRFKVYIIDEVHMLTREAFNALLKTLEEPPPNVVFVLATTEPHKIPETILSRCQRFDFRRPQVGDIARLLARIVESENQRSEEERGGPPIEIQEAALIEIARHSQGGFRDAIGTLEKLITYADGAIMPADVLEALGVTGSDLLFEVTDLCIERQTAAVLQFVQRLANEGVDYPQFIRDLLRHLRQLFLLQHLEDAAEDEATLRVLGQTVELDDQLLRRLVPQAHQLAPRELIAMIETLGQAQRDIKDGLDARLQLELALVKVTRPQVDPSPAGLEERLRRLEAGLGQTRAAGVKADAAASGQSGVRTAGAAASAQSGVTASGATGQAPNVHPMPPAPTVQPLPPAPDQAATGPDETASGPNVQPPRDEPAPQPSMGPRREPEGAAAQGTPAPTTATAAGSAPGETRADAADAPTPTGAEPAEHVVLTLDRVRRAWELVLQRVQAGSVPLYALLRDARPTALGEGRLTVALASNFALNRAREAGNDRLLAAAVAETLGQELTPEFVLAEGRDADQPTTPDQTAPGPPTLDFTQTINLAKQVLDAEELDQNP